MLHVRIPPHEYYDESKKEFVNINVYELVLEHSLVSVAKWESKWHKPFMSKTPKTNEETYDYIRCMTISQHNSSIDYSLIPQSVIDKIENYISDPMTATTFARPEEKATSREVITAEIIYYWMVSFNIPPEYQKWHLNRLLTLINVCSIKNQPPKKLTTAEKNKILADRKKLNDERRAKLGTKG